MTTLFIILAYLAILLALGFVSNRFSRANQVDYFLASRGVGPVLLLMSLFGTTMTAFAMVGSAGESSQKGIGVYGLMASASGIVHALCFYLIGPKLWAFGKRFGYLTQIQFFRDRFDSNAIGLVLFPVLVAMLFPYLLTGILGLGSCITGATAGAFPNAFPDTRGAVPPWLGEGIIVAVVLIYIFVGGLRSTVWVNAFQNFLFMGVGLVALVVIADELGGFQHATHMARESRPALLQRALDPGYTQLEWLSYMLIPLSVAVFPHLFQYYLTAKSADAFKLSVVGHPIFVLITWLPCVLLGVWFVTGHIDGNPILPDNVNPNTVLALGIKNLTGPILGGLMAAGILATNSLDAQFLVLGNMFTNDVVVHYAGRERFTDRQLLRIGRAFVVAVVLVAYVVSLLEPRAVFRLGIWCFSGFAGLAPLTFAALYWRRATRLGAYASILTGAIVWYTLFHASQYGRLDHFSVAGWHPVAPITAAAALALVLVSLLTPPPSTETLARFFPERP